MNSKVNLYLQDGCGRCSHYQTPQCKVHLWKEELKQLRRIALESGLAEVLKWSQPCYTYQNKNILIVSAFKDYALMAFFKGVLLKDELHILVAAGKNSQSSMHLRFITPQEVLDLEPIIKSYIQEAIALEKSGLKVSFKKKPEPIPDELQQKLDDDKSFRKAFESLSPVRQRGYIIHFSQPKQSKTGMDRIDKCLPSMLNGKGFHDR